MMTLSLSLSLSNNSRRQYFLGIEVYKIFHATFLHYLTEIFIKCDDSLRRSARSLVLTLCFLHSHSSVVNLHYSF